jgi:hypothetical protein
MKKNLIPKEAVKIESRVIARGEVSGHSHIITGDADVYELNGEKFIHVKSKASIKHLLEREYVEEKREVWTKEHQDIDLQKGFYKYVPQVEYDPYNDIIKVVLD